MALPFFIVFSVAVYRHFRSLFEFADRLRHDRLAQQQAESEKQLQKQAQRRQEGGLNANISGILKQQQSASNSGGATLLTGAGGAGTSGTLGAGGTLA